MSHRACLGARIGRVSALVTLASVDRERETAPAIIDAGRIWTYRELRGAADRLAEAMRADHLFGERVALMLPNSAELVASYLACFTSGDKREDLASRLARRRHTGTTG
jgi:long-chain acyl-CoA synthetase